LPPGARTGWRRHRGKPTVGHVCETAYFNTDLEVVPTQQIAVAITILGDVNADQIVSPDAFLAAAGGYPCPIAVDASSQDQPTTRASSGCPAPGARLRVSSSKTRVTDRHREMGYGS
jgi:hypothetical protein